jgi:hypothetical protein
MAASPHVSISAVLLCTMNVIILPDSEHGGSAIWHARSPRSPRMRPRNCTTLTRAVASGHRKPRVRRTWLVPACLRGGSQVVLPVRARPPCPPSLLPHRRRGAGFVARQRRGPGVGGALLLPIVLPSDRYTARAAQRSRLLHRNRTDYCADTSTHAADWTSLRWSSYRL